MAPAIPPAHARMVCDADDDISYYALWLSTALLEKLLLVATYLWLVASCRVGVWSVPTYVGISIKSLAPGKILLRPYLLSPSQPPT